MGWNTRAPELTQACTACYDDMYLDGSICTADEGVGSDNFEEKPTFRKSWEHRAIWRNPRTKWRFGKNIDSIGVSRLAMVDFRWVKLDAVFGCHFCWTSAGVCFRWTFTTSCENRVFIKSQVTQCHSMSLYLSTTPGFQVTSMTSTSTIFCSSTNPFLLKTHQKCRWTRRFRHGVPARHGTPVELRGTGECPAGKYPDTESSRLGFRGHGPTVICLLHGISFGISWDFPHGYPYGWSYTHCCDLSPNMYT